MIPSEDEEQTGLFSLAEIRYGDALKWMFHIPNGGKRSGSEAARFKAMGVKPGVSDVFVPLARGGYHGLWIEMKALDGKVSRLQAEFLHDMAEEGYAAAVCYGMEEAIGVIDRYMRGTFQPGGEGETERVNEADTEKAGTVSGAEKSH